MSTNSISELQCIEIRYIGLKIVSILKFQTRDYGNRNYHLMHLVSYGTTSQRRSSLPVELH